MLLYKKLLLMTFGTTLVCVVYSSLALYDCLKKFCLHSSGCESASVPVPNELHDRHEGPLEVKIQTFLPLAVDGGKL